MWLAETITIWRRNKETADKAIAQLSERQLRASLHPELNSVAVVMKHVAGNLRSRWRDFLTSDGEKPDRNRDNEFVDDYPDRDAMVADWEAGWRVLFDSLAELEPDDTGRRVAIRGEEISVPQAILRSITHCAYHVGQIVQTARAVAGDDWETLTIARGQSEAYNRRRWGAG
ncbi:MAG: DinB family protein [Planctomycetota bacterium]